MEKRKKAIVKKYHPKGSGMMAIDISELTDRKVKTDSETIRSTGSDQVNSGIYAELSDEKYEGTGANYWRIKTELTKQRGIKSDMYGAVALDEKTGKVWTKPVPKPEMKWEDMDAEQVFKNLEETDGEYAWKESGNKKHGKVEKKKTNKN